MINELVDKRSKLTTEILDIGCGKGYLGQYLKEGGFLRLTGVDVSKTLLGMSK